MNRPSYKNVDLKAVQCCISREAYAKLLAVCEGKTRIYEKKYRDGSVKKLTVPLKPSEYAARLIEKGVKSVKAKPEDVAMLQKEAVRRKIVISKRKIARWEKSLAERGKLPDNARTKSFSAQDERMLEKERNTLSALEKELAAIG